MQSENIMLVDKLKMEKEQNAQLRNQVAQLLQLEQDQKMQMQQRDLTIQTLQVGLPPLPPFFDFLKYTTDMLE